MVTAVRRCKPRSAFSALFHLQGGNPPFCSAPLQKKNDDDELHLKTRPRRAFGKRSPAPRKPKGKPQAGHSSERTVEGRPGLW